jgi:hypothetical protein
MTVAMRNEFPAIFALKLSSDRIAEKFVRYYWAQTALYVALAS